MKKANPRRLTLLGFLTAKGWVWKAAIAGLCGSITHTLLMVAKAQLGILESFQPYQSLQLALSHWTGESVHPMVPWLLSYLNGSTAAGFAFANLYPHLPGNSGAMKGFISGVLEYTVEPAARCDDAKSPEEKLSRQSRFFLRAPSRTVVWQVMQLPYTSAARRVCAPSLAMLADGA
jgi:hypothetical protein